ncbi:carbohydrate kinase family protein [Candidatus Bipolaricaulota bacterium]|nr:carbohydrate kinase family protein [Candidatus Bipolaricaulota bacterium]
MVNKVKVLGAPFLDLMHGYPLPQMDEEFSSGLKLTLTPGGPASNLAAGIQRLGIDTAIIGKVGADWFGSYLEKAFQKEGIGVSGLQMTTGESTGIVFPVIDRKGIQRSFELLNDPLQFELSEIEVERSFTSESKFLFADGILLMGDGSSKALIKGVKMAQENGVSVIFDPNFRLPATAVKNEAKDALEEVLDLTDFLLLNGEELELLQEVLSPEREREDLVKDLLESETKGVVVKRGERGHEVFTEEGAYKSEAFSIESVDTQGAGDAFDAGFIAGLTRGLSPRRAAVTGSAAGAIVCSEETTWTPLPDLETLKFFLEEKGEEELADGLSGD